MAHPPPVPYQCSRCGANVSAPGICSDCREAEEAPTRATPQADR